MGDANKTSTGTTKVVEQGQHSMQTSMPMNTTVAVSHKEKPSKFTGQNFKTWQQKMLFYLTMLNLAKYLKEDTPVVAVGDGEGEVVEQGQHSMQTSMPMNTTVAVSHNEKPSKFTSQNFKTWQQKMLFYLTMPNLANVDERKNSVDHVAFRKPSIAVPSFLKKTNDEFERLGWNHYKKLIKDRINPNRFDKLVFELITLWKKNSIAQYYEEFIMLRTRNIGNQSKDAIVGQISLKTVVAYLEMFVKNVIDSVFVLGKASCLTTCIYWKLQKGKGQESNVVLSFNFNIPHLNSSNLWKLIMLI
ncbi:hypothetical protein GQ457_09G020390 [Hibiscus cannabinus]